VDGKDSLTVKLDFPFDLNVSSYKIYAALDPQKLLPDFNRGNNLDSSSIQVNMFNLVPELGSTYKNVSNDTIKMGDFQFWLGAGEITGSAAVSYEINDITTSFQQAGLTPVLLRNLDKPVGLMLTKFNDEAKLTSPFLLNLQLSNTHYDSTTSAEKLPKLYRWDERMQVWLQQDAVLDTSCGCLTARLQETGFYAPFISSDNQPPRIELTVDGRQIRSKSLVSPNPVLNIVFEDESGLNIDRNRIRVMVDDAVLPQEKIFIPDSVQQSKVMGITAYPDLDIGQHSLQIDVKDVNGNESTKNYSLKVDDAFDLKVFGNYPNPFSDETIFSYYITSRDIIDDLEIRIFTTSGRLIKRIKNDMNTITPGNDPRRVGYNELIWDGTDEDGNQVANGVYFALVRAKYEGKERQEILKVAKLK
ncbi:MAG: hypothetical protein P8184_00815, partial [Calditrichia bacterium]